jgi:hypothetical protein
VLAADGRALLGVTTGGRLAVAATTGRRPHEDSSLDDSSSEEAWNRRVNGGMLGLERAAL